MSRQIKYEAIHSKTLLNRVTAPSMPFEWSINPYRGCQHGCSFCYARNTHSFLGMETDDKFQNHIFFKENAPEALEEQLKKMLRSKAGAQKIGRVAIGTATDPYQPVEAKALLTRKCLEILAAYQVPTSITTRSPLVLRDLDLLKQMPVISVNLSVNTMDISVWKNLEPSTPAPLKRLETVQQLNEEGVPAGIFLAPLLPLLTDQPDQLQAVITAAAKHKAMFAMPSFLRLSTAPVKSWFFHVLEQHYPQLMPKYNKLYEHSSYLPNYYREAARKTIEAILKEHGVSGIEPFSGQKTAQHHLANPLRANDGPLANPLHTNDSGSPPASGDEPVQLSFTF
jgi:DNA repair photolyase